MPRICYEPARLRAAGLEVIRQDLVLAYPDPKSRGTWQCVRAACDRGITTVVWAPEEVAYLWDFEGEDDIKPGGWANLEMVDAQPRFIISTCDNRALAEQFAEVLGGAPAGLTTAGLDLAKRLPEGQ